MTLAMLGIVIAAAVSGCGPAEQTSSLRTTATTPASTAAPTAVATTPRPKPRVVAPKPAPTPTPKTAPKPTPKPTPKPVARSTCGAPANPWGYNFCGRGSHITSPAAAACSYFNCIDNFDNGVGYMVQCNDGRYSMSGGRSGACSRHGGEGRAVYGGP